jgi:hypothetical protein
VLMTRSLNLFFFVNNDEDRKSREGQNKLDCLSHQPGLIFTSKGESYLSGASFRFVTREPSLKGKAQ